MTPRLLRLFGLWAFISILIFGTLDVWFDLIKIGANIHGCVESPQPSKHGPVIFSTCLSDLQDVAYTYKNIRQLKVARGSQKNGRVFHMRQAK